MVENVLYPAYFDATLSRGEGRRVAQEMAIEDPDVEEIASAVGQVGYDAVVERNCRYSRESWRSRGRVLVKDVTDATKNDLVQAVGAYLQALRE